MGFLRACIHRGANEIGGSCIELAAGGARLVLDLGRPLDAPPGVHVPLPPVPGLARADRSLLGVVLSHSHADHAGLCDALAAETPLFVGEAAHRILAEAAWFGAGGLVRAPRAFLRDRVPLELGPFRITPLLVDHSAFDAHALAIEAGGRRLLYTGDLRGHGRKARLFEALVHAPPPDIDVLLMEGTHVRATGGLGRGPSERDVEVACAETFRATRGLALALYSPQNVDRLVTLYRAARRAGRDLVIDLYTAAVAAATGRATIPQASWPHVRVYLPRAQRARVIAARAFARTDAVRARRIFADELRARRGELVMTFRASMLAELDAAAVLDGAAAVWSMWPGYLRDDRNRVLAGVLAARGIPLRVHHASGHAFVPDLQRLVAAIQPARVVPIHTAAPARFAALFPRVTPHADGEWWDA